MQHQDIETSDEVQNNRLKKIISVLIFFLITFFILYKSFFVTSQFDRDILLFESKKVDLAIRGAIISEDGYALCYSKKKYKATINVNSIDEDKLDMFIKLFSIYSNIEKYKIRQAFINAKLDGKIWFDITTDLDEHQASAIKILSVRLQRLKVFVPIKIRNNNILYAISVSENKEERIYPYGDLFQPALGYIQTKNKKQKGIKGLEYFYNKRLDNKQDGFYEGKRDINSYALFNRDSTLKNRIDGEDIKTSINLVLQKNVEILLDHYKTKFDSSEIIASVVRSSDGQIVALASSNRVNANNIKQSDIKKLNLSFVERIYEPGSIMKPIIGAIALAYGYVNQTSVFRAYNKGKVNKWGYYSEGKLKIGRYTITDDHKFKTNILSFDEIIIYSSNIGAAQIANLVLAYELDDGLKKFGFGKKSNSDMTYEQTGKTPKIDDMEKGEKSDRLNIYKSTLSYGYGISVNFMQMLKAFNVFNNDGKIIDISIAKYDKPNIKILESKTNDIINKILIDVVSKGTGRATYKIGLKIGGKTGTAKISNKGSYKESKINSSFFGFVNDEQNKYTIGISIFDIPKEYVNKYYYASKSSVVVFSDIVDKMLEAGMLRQNALQEEYIEQ